MIKELPHTPIVYLLHFDKKLHHAQHYVGCSTNLEHRIAQHRKGWSGTALVRAFKKHKINFTVARTWEQGGWEYEKYLKKHYKSSRQLCPICRADMSKSHE